MQVLQQPSLRQNRALLTTVVPERSPRLHEVRFAEGRRPGVLGPAASLSEAQELLAKERPTAAVLDVNLGGEYVFPLVRQLQAGEVPFVFATAYADDDRLFPEEARTPPRLPKPVLPNVLIGQLMRIVRQ